MATLALGIEPLLITILTLSACRVEDVFLVAPPNDGGRPGIPGLESLAIDPPTSVVVDDGLSPPETRSFRAIGRFADGDRDVSAEVDWALSAVNLGTVEGGYFQSAGLGGRGTIHASSGAVSAMADLEIRLEAVEPGEGVSPSDIALFPSDTSSDSVDAAALDFRYPSHEVMLPQNLGGLAFEWTARAELDRFQVIAKSPIARIRYYSVGPSLRLSPSSWARLAASNAGGEVVVELRGLSRAMPGRIYAAPPITIAFSQAEIPGALYYWSTTTRALMRSKLDAPLATRVNLPTEAGACVGCHALSRDGKKVAYSEGGRLRVASLPDLTQLSPDEGGGPRFGSGAFSPDGTRLLVSDRGELELFDANTFTSLGPVALPNGQRASQPDWSPDGRFVAITYLDDPSGDDRMLNDDNARGTSLGILPVDAAGNFGAPQVLVAPGNEDDDTIIAPSVSPDSTTIAYARGRGRSKDNRRLEIFLVRVEGGGGPVPLSRLNRRGGGHRSIRDVANGFAVWAPSARAGVNWLAFGSTRDVGLSPSGGYDQLWIAEIDLTRVVPGDDPSRSAFWLPFQRLGEANHRPQWTPVAADACGSSVDICGNGIDDDCSGTADDLCCTPGTETCANSIDDDCDGVADEGCGCALAEICTNTVDDDCDGAADNDDSDCDDD